MWILDSPNWRCFCRCASRYSGIWSSLVGREATSCSTYSFCIFAREVRETSRSRFLTQVTIKKTQMMRETHRAKVSRQFGKRVNPRKKNESFFQARFAAFGFHQIVVDGHNVDELLAAFEEAKKDHKKVRRLEKQVTQYHACQQSKTTSLLACALNLH